MTEAVISVLHKKGQRSPEVRIIQTCKPAHEWLQDLDQDPCDLARQGHEFCSASWPDRICFRNFLETCAQSIWPYIISLLVHNFTIDEILYSSPKACVRTNKMISNYFALQRGTRRPCPLSPRLQYNYWAPPWL